eukprot:CAMPEP_0172455240 /NCGR_PEP_ID=MMETSP1065-20121228/11966_1 /TAXON_ID=265537 /ORGANISM="Amphiprora paludosa, Strain CCMP125" /LENGTH=284 /DNA_ID=CAMNT_0013207699 /DNA_START=40 /DNA_END=894 /DNA_ORIENTATION=-
MSTTPTTLTGPPVSAYVAPGSCQFTDTPVAVPLLSRTPVSETSSVLRFGLPDTNQPLNLCTCACLLAKSEINGESVVRPYTPISTNAHVGYFDLLVKHYGPQAQMSRHLHEIHQGSEAISFFHIPFNVKLQAPEFLKDYDNILMLIGGTGVTPMIQALHEILGSSTLETKKQPKVTILYGSRVSNDILGRDLLDAWAAAHPDQLTVHHVLSHEPEDSSWTGLRGWISKDLIASHFPPATTPRVGVWVCGPPPMYNALSGPREEADQVSGVLGELGFTAEQVYKY